MRNKTPGKQTVVTIPARQKLSQNDLKQLKATFDLFDQDGTGSIDPSQIQKILQQLGLDKRNQSVFQMIIDLQGKGKLINYDDFLQVIYGKLGDTRSKQGLQKIFNLYDSQLSGVIDIQKIKRVCGQLGQTMSDQQIMQMMHNTHILNKTQSNQQFTFEQFYAIVTKKKY